MLKHNVVAGVVLSSANEKTAYRLSSQAHLSPYPPPQTHPPPTSTPPTPHADGMDRRRNTYRNRSKAGEHAGGKCRVGVVAPPCALSHRLDSCHRILGSGDVDVAGVTRRWSWRGRVVEYRTARTLYVADTSVDDMDGQRGERAFAVWREEVSTNIWE